MIEISGDLVNIQMDQQYLKVRPDEFQLLFVGKFIVMRVYKAIYFFEKDLKAMSKAEKHIFSLFEIPV